jgi:hypothetical protein
MTKINRILYIYKFQKYLKSQQKFFKSRLLKIAGLNDLKIVKKIERPF